MNSDSSCFCCCRYLVAPASTNLLLYIDDGRIFYNPYTYQDYQGDGFQTNLSGPS